MTARDWLMRQNPARRPRVGVPQVSEGFARFVDAIAAEREASAAVAAMRAEPVPDPPERFTEAAVTSARAPWVPVPQPTPMLTGAQAEQSKTAFERYPGCPVCAYRYSRCYCEGGDRG